MWEEDINGSIAYAKSLVQMGVVSAAESQQLIEGLEKVKAEWASGSFVLKPSDEDIHTANERRLTELIGPLGGKVRKE